MAINWNQCIFQQSELMLISDPFAAFRSSSSKESESSRPPLEQECTAYLTSKCASTDPLDFWRKKKEEYPTLAAIARNVLVIQATSGESERHFSSAGRIVSESRSRLDADSVESLVVLREASINNLWG